MILFVKKVWSSDKIVDNVDIPKKMVNDFGITVAVIAKVWHY